MKYSSLFWFVAIGYFCLESLMLYLALFYPNYLAQHGMCSKQGCDSWLADGLVLVTLILQLASGAIPKDLIDSDLFGHVKGHCQNDGSNQKIGVWPETLAKQIVV